MLPQSIESGHNLMMKNDDDDDDDDDDDGQGNKR